MSTQQPVSAFDYQDYRDAFLAALQGLITHNGLNMASEGHFRATVTNVDGLAVEAAKALRLRRPLVPDTGLDEGLGGGL